MTKRIGWTAAFVAMMCGLGAAGGAAAQAGSTWNDGVTWRPSPLAARPNGVAGFEPARPHSYAPPANTYAHPRAHPYPGLPEVGGTPAGFKPYQPPQPYKPYSPPNPAPPRAGAARAFGYPGS